MEEKKSDVTADTVSHTGSDHTAVGPSSTGEKKKVHIYDPSQETVWTRAGLSWESFKRAPGPTGEQIVAGVANIEDVEGDMPLLQPKMKSRHLNMISVGGSIGTGLFVGSGAALNAGGPAGLIIAYILIGAMLINVTQALGEMSIVYPVSGGFYTLAIRFLDPSFAFAMGWNYVFQWAVVLPLELTVAVTTVQYWTNDDVSVAAWVTIFYVVIIFASLFGTLGFAEEEFWSSILKLLVLLMFIFIGIVCCAGGGPKSGEYGEYVGGKYWSNPGAFANGFKGVCAVFVTAAFSFSGTELVGLAASETKNPRAVMPGAVKGTFWRIIVIFITSLTIVGLLLPYDEPRLIGGSGSSASPFVLILLYSNISGLDHLINATICISVMSIGLSCVYAGSRTLTALAETGFAPKIFGYVDKSSRPLFSVAAILAFGPIAYANCSDDGDTVFKWLLALSGLSTIFTWMAICLCHIRFRAAWKAQGHSLEALPFRAMGGVWGSWFGVILNGLVLIAQFYVAVFPVGKSVSGRDAADSFFSAYLAAPIMIAFYIAGYAWKRQLPKRASEIDLDSGRKSWLTVEEMRAYRASRAEAPWHIRIYRMLFSN